MAAQRSCACGTCSAAPSTPRSAGAHHVASLAALSDGRLVSGSGDTPAKVWSIPIAAGALALCSATLEGHTDTVTALARLPDGRVASGSMDGTVRVWA